MDQSEKLKIAEALIELADSLGAEFSPTRQQIYIKRLADVPFPQLMSAIQRCFDVCRFFPAMAELRQMAGQGQVSIEDEAVIAWDKLRCLKPSRSYNEAALEDPLIAECFRSLGGRTLFGMWNFERDEQWKRKEFLQLFAAKKKCAVLALTHDQSQDLLCQINSNKQLSGTEQT